jgi:hypothetical protein
MRRDKVVAHLYIDEEERLTLIEALDNLLGIFDDWGEPLTEAQQNRAFRAHMLLDTLRKDGDAVDHPQMEFHLADQPDYARPIKDAELASAPLKDRMAAGHPPYPWCFQPEVCKGRTTCPRNPNCGD